MVLKINSNKDKVYDIIFKHLSIEYEWKLSNTDLKVLSSFYTENNNLFYKIKSYDERMVVLFSTDSKKRLATLCKISYAAFMNSVTNIRKEGLITENLLDKQFMFDINKKSFTFALEIIIEDEEISPTIR